MFNVLPNLPCLAVNGVSHFMLYINLNTMHNTCRTSCWGSDNCYRWTNFDWSVSPSVVVAVTIYIPAESADTLISVCLVCNTH